MVPSLLAGSTKGFICEIHWENQGKLLEVKSSEVRPPPCPPEGTLLGSSTLSLHRVINYRPGLSTPGLVPGEVSAHEFAPWKVVILCTCLSLPDLEDDSLPCGLTSLNDLRRTVHFQFVQLFICG